MTARRASNLFLEVLFVFSGILLHLALGHSRPLAALAGLGIVHSAGAGGLCLQAVVGAYRG